MKKVIDVSVIIPVYNSDKTIFRAIQSIVDQTVLPKSIIIVDDKSTDNTIEKVNSIINTYRGNIEIKLIQLKNNSGPSKARNTGWNSSTSKYVSFLDSDDSWHPQKLEIQYNFMKNNPEIKLVGHLMELCLDEKPKVNNINLDNKIIYSIVSEKILINKNLFTTTSNIMIKNDIKLRFNEEMRYAEDYYLWLEICFKYKIALLNYNLGYAYKSYTGISGLSGNIIAMYKGSLRVSDILLKQKKITTLEYIYRISLRTIKFIIAFLKKHLLKG